VVEVAGWAELPLEFLFRRRLFGCAAFRHAVPGIAHRRVLRVDRHGRNFIHLDQILKGGASCAHSTAVAVLRSTK
jgi:hypothetical protein